MLGAKAFRPDTAGSWPVVRGWKSRCCWFPVGLCRCPRKMQTSTATAKSNEDAVFPLVIDGDRLGISSLDGNPPIPVSDPGFVDGVAYGPDGALIYVQHSGRQPGFYRVEDGSPQRVIPLARTDPWLPAKWSPDASRAAWIEIEADGESHTLMLATPGEAAPRGTEQCRRLPLVARRRTTSRLERLGCAGYLRDRLPDRRSSSDTTERIARRLDSVGQRPHLGEDRRPRYPQAQSCAHTPWTAATRRNRRIDRFPLRSSVPPFVGGSRNILKTWAMNCI